MNKSDLFKYMTKPVSLLKQDGTQWGSGELGYEPSRTKGVQSWFIVIASPDIFDGGPSGAIMGASVFLSDQNINAMTEQNGHLCLVLPLKQDS